MKLIHTTETGALADLQAKDRIVDDISGKIAAIPVEIGALNEAFEEKKNSMNTAKETLVGLKVKKKEKELLVAEKDEEMRKHQRDLNMIKDNAAFKALLAEIEHAKKAKDDVETEILGIMDEIDQAVLEDNRLQEEVKKLEKEKDIRTRELEEARKRLEADLEAAKAERAVFAGRISPELTEKYEFIRAQRKGLAIVRVHEDKAGKISCGGCNMGLTAQKIVDIKTPDALVFCDNCQRMIYLDKTVRG